MWDRACSRMRCVRQLICRLIHRIREQARSHIDFVVADAGQSRHFPFFSHLVRIIPGLAAS
ncbi:hypothetical protein E3W21_15295 [Pseudomonas sp. F01002]|nr:hypothetical protein E3W21_15295 [Pseudomonas sp. F01002]